MPDGFETTDGNFDLALSEDGQTVSGPVALNQSITVTVNLSGEVIASSEGRETNLVIHHYKGSGGWEELATTVDFAASTASAQVNSLSLFTLTLRMPVSVPSSTDTPEPPTTIPSATTAPTATPAPAPSPTPEPVARYKLDTEVEAANLGTVTVRPTSDDGRYPAGGDVVLTAQCSTAFGTWEGSVPQGTSRTSATITVPMDRDRVLVAICLEPTPTPAPTPTTTPRPTPTPTATPMPPPVPDSY